MTKSLQGPVPRATRLVGVPAVLVSLAWAAQAHAWIWPEHRDIAVEGIRTLPQEDRRALEALWAALKADAGPQLCPVLVDDHAAPTTAFGQWREVCIDFPSYPALGGDHSCSTADLRAATEKEEWGKKVAWVAEWSKGRLASTPNESRRTDAWNESHLAMQYVDPDYLTRAAGNDAHFLLPRLPVEDTETIDVYVSRAVAPGVDINATAIYVQYHELALRLAARFAGAPPTERPDLARRALLAEGVAIHFLEDSFSAGHYAATWGDAPWQKGTHDLYCVEGLTSMTWGGKLFASHGDAHMDARDLKVAGAAVRTSLVQLAAAASGRLAVSSSPLSAEEKAVEDVDFCKAKSLPPVPPDAVARRSAIDTLQASPIPSGSSESIHPPRARADIGPFVGAVAGLSAGPAFGGYDTTSGWRFRTEFEVGARFGYGLEGVLTRAMDGHIWAQASFVADPAQLDASCPGCEGGTRTNPAYPRVPGRSALKLALRMPYYLIPFDLVLLEPILLLADSTAAQHVLFTSTGGGLLTIQRPLSTPAGTFQFMAGREVGLTLWGYLGSENQFIPPQTAGSAQLVDYRSLEFDFPILEYVPPRAFATVLSLAAEFQLGFSVEFPQKPTLQPAGTPYDLGTSWFVYLRFRLDARKYFGGSPEDWKN